MSPFTRDTLRITRYVLCRAILLSHDTQRKYLFSSPPRTRVEKIPLLQRERARNVFYAAVHHKNCPTTPSFSAADIL